MAQRSIPDLIELLLATLRYIEHTENPSPGDPALLALKHFFLRTLAELEIAKLGKSEAA